MPPGGVSIPSLLGEWLRLMRPQAVCLFYSQDLFLLLRLFNPKASSARTEEVSRFLASIASATVAPP